MPPISWLGMGYSNQSSKTSARRLIAMSGLVVGIVFSGWCYWWLANADLSLLNDSGVWQLLTIAFVALVSGASALMASRTRWRWLLLLFLLPVGFVFSEYLLRWWTWYYRTGLLPYFLLLPPLAFVSYALRALANNLTKSWVATLGAFSWRILGWAAFQALPIALLFTPTMYVQGEMRFIIPASWVLFLPGFDVGGKLVAGGLFGSVWAFLTFCWWRHRPVALTPDKLFVSRYRPIPPWTVLGLQAIWLLSALFAARMVEIRGPASWVVVALSLIIALAIYLRWRPAFWVSGILLAWAAVRSACLVLVLLHHLIRDAAIFTPAIIVLMWPIFGLIVQACGWLLNQTELTFEWFRFESVSHVRKWFWILAGAAFVFAVVTGFYVLRSGALGSLIPNAGD